jgi:hypothetical protein
MRITSDAINRLSSLPQFQGLSDEALIRVAYRRTKLYVPDRWVAIALILGNRVPIPVPGGKARPWWQVKKVKTPIKLRLVQGGRAFR